MFSEKTDVPQLWIFSFFTAVTLEIRSKSPKSNQVFVMSQLQLTLVISNSLISNNRLSWSENLVPA